MTAGTVGTTIVERIYAVEVETTVTMVRKTKATVFNAENTSHSKFKYCRIATYLVETAFFPCRLHVVRLFSKIKQ